MNTEQYERQLKRSSWKIIASFVICIALAIISDLALSYLSSGFDSLINISGRQRMLSQRLAFIKTKGDQPIELKKNLKLFEKSHELLSKSAQDKVKIYYESKLNLEFNGYVNYLKSKAFQEEILFEKSQSILPLLNQAVLLFEQQSNFYQKTKLYLNLFFVIIVLVLVFILYFRYFKPQRKNIINTLNLYEVEKNKSLESLRVKNDFLANMTHELRTPLNAIIVASDLLDETSLDKEQKDLHKILSSGSSSLLEIINDILDASSIERENLTINREDLNLHEKVDNLARLANTLIQDKNIKLNLQISKDVPTFINSDPKLLKQILLNILSNSAKFTIEGSIDFKVSLVENSIEFSISDTGLGIKEEDLDHIFSSFKQLENPYKKDTQGSGLGLFITKKLCDLLDCKISVSSSFGEGTTFTVSLPYIEASNASENQVQQPKTVKLTSKIGKILVVEDNKINQKIICKVLEKFKIDYDISNNGQEGVEAFEKGKYELILMDLSMPIMDGAEATLKIREHDTEIPIFCLSANSFQEAIDKAFAAGVNEFVTKPIDKNKLITLINEYTNKP